MDSARPRKNLEMVPFRWEEEPGLPLDKSFSDELFCNTPSFLQLPPKLESQGNGTPLPSIDKSEPLNESYLMKRPTQPIDRCLVTSSHGKPRFKRLCKFLSSTAFCTRPSQPFFSHSWSHRPPRIGLRSPSLNQHPDNQHDIFDFHGRFFFDKHSPRDLRYGASTNSIIPIFDASDGEEEDLVGKSALSLLAMEKYEDGERASDYSPWQPLSFSNGYGPASPYWQPASSTKLQKSSLQHYTDDNDDADSFHDFFGSGNSKKPSHRTDDTLESGSSSPTTPWYLNFSPEVEEMHTESRKSSLIVRLVDMRRLKRVISRFKRRRAGASHHQFAESPMWSPTLATYLRNQQLEEEEEKMSTEMFSTTSYAYVIDDDRHTELGSNSLRIDPNYYLPSTIRTHFISPNRHIFSDGNKYGDDDECDNQNRYDWKSDAKGSCRVQEEKVRNHHLYSISHRLSLRAQLSEFDDDEVLPNASHVQCLRNSETPAGHPRSHSCKGMCKVRKTVKILVSTIKVLLIRTETGKRRETHRSL